MRYLAYENLEHRRLLAADVRIIQDPVFLETPANARERPPVSKTVPFNVAELATHNSWYSDADVNELTRGVAAGPDCYLIWLKVSCPANFAQLDDSPH